MRKLFPLLSACLIGTAGAETVLPVPFRSEMEQENCLVMAAMLWPDAMIEEMEMEALEEFDKKKEMNLTEIITEVIETLVEEVDHKSACCGVALDDSLECKRCFKSPRAEVDVYAFGQWHIVEYDPEEGTILQVETND